MMKQSMECKIAKLLSLIHTRFQPGVEVLKNTLSVSTVSRTSKETETVENG